MNWKRALPIAAGLGALLASAPASAQFVIGMSEDPEDAIVVTGKPDPEPQSEEIHTQARRITQGSNFFEEPLARFEQPLCPGVLGLPLEMAEMIVGRIRANAEELGIRLAKDGGCQPNLIVGFVGSGQADIQRLLDTKGSMLAQIPRDERESLLKDPGPVHAWSVVSARTRDGMPVLGDRKYGLTPTVNVQSANSLISLTIRNDIEISVVLFDVLDTDGMSIVQLADYATMRGLAQTKAVTGETTYGTILNLFDEDAQHYGRLTPFDRAYLKALYSNVPNIPAVAKIGAVKGLMAKELAAAEDAGQP